MEQIPLQEPSFRPLPLGSIRPQGWLARQLRIQADGLSGHLDEFWPDIKDSRWFGGEAEGWERAPYWLDGVIPLAYILDDAPLKEKVERYVDTILSHQAEDGWLGPEQMVWTAGQSPTPLRNYDIWAQFLILKALVQYGDATGDSRVAPAVERCLQSRRSPHRSRPALQLGQLQMVRVVDLGLLVVGEGRARSEHQPERGRTRSRDQGSGVVGRPSSVVHRR